MGFAPTPEQTRAESVYASWHEKGKKSVPASGGARDTYWTNVSRGNEILRRIQAVGGASSPDELRHKELIQSPKYILEQLEKEAARLAEITRLELVEKNRLLDLESQRLVELEIAKQTAIDEYIIEQKEITRIENQRLENERIELENQTIVTPISNITNPIITPIIEKKKEIGIGLIVLGAIGTLLILLKK